VEVKVKHNTADETWARIQYGKNFG